MATTMLKIMIPENASPGEIILVCLDTKSVSVDRHYTEATFTTSCRAWFEGQPVSVDVGVEI